MSGEKLKYDLRLWGIRLAFLAAGLIIAHFDHHLRLWDWVQDQSGFTCSMHKSDKWFN